VRRTLSLIVLCGFALVLVSCGSSANKTATTEATSTTVDESEIPRAESGQKKVTPSTVKTKPDTPACQAVVKFQTAGLIAIRPESKAPDRQAGVLGGIVTTGNDVKKLVPALDKSITVQSVYYAKLVKSEPLSSTEKEASDTAKAAIAAYRTANCPKPAAAAAAADTK
jgi:hypothetical protein